MINPRHMRVSVALLAAAYSGAHNERGNGEGGKEREAPMHSNLTHAAPRITRNRQNLKVCSLP